MKLALANSILVLLVFAGCGLPTVEHPLINPDSAERVPDFHGVYQSKNPKTGESSWLHIGVAGKLYPKGFHKFIWIGPGVKSNGLWAESKELTPVELYGYFEKLDDSYILHVPVLRPGEEHDQSGSKLYPGGWDPDRLRHFILFRFKEFEKGIVVDVLNPKYVTSQIESKSLSGTIREEKIDPGHPKSLAILTPHIEESPTELRALLSDNNRGDLYSKEPMNFRKME